MAAPHRDAAEAYGVVIQAFRIEGHHALGMRERYHAHLRRIFNAILTVDRSFHNPCSLRLAVKAISDTMGPDGLVPISLVFGRLRRLPGHDIKPTQTESASTLAAALAKVAQAASEELMNRALRSQVPPPARMWIHSGGNVRVDREVSQRREGPFTVTRTVRKCA